MDLTIFAWNCQGAASSRFHTALNSYLQGCRPDILILVEPRISGLKADVAIKKIGFANSHRVEAQGYSGGIWVMWRDTHTINVLQNHRQFVHMEVTSEANDTCLVTAVYGSPNSTMRDKLWQGLTQIHCDPLIPWVIVGDFNATVASTERSGGGPIMSRGNAGFRRFLSQTGLIDLGSVGPKFTWQRGHLKVRLDRAVGNSQWLNQFPDTQVFHLHRIKSDHRPLLIRNHVEGRRPLHPFKFLASWLLHPTFPDLVKSSWDNNKDLVSNIKVFTTNAREWNRTVFGHIGQQKRRIERRLVGIQRALEDPTTPSSLSYLEKELQQELHDLCLKEELLWLQKSRSEWIKDGDRNTKYYHARAVIQRRRKKVTMLKNDVGEWVADSETLKTMAQEYFQRLYQLEETTTHRYNISGLFPLIPNALMQALAAPVTMLEVKQAVFDMAPLKSPGIDGLHALFFQSQWDLIGTTVFKEIQQFFQHGHLNEELNRTVIALIPKVECPQSIKEFRPISLCTTVYKAITKLLANRLKPIMPILVLPQQSSFVQGRSIIDNVIIGQELVHAMRRKQGSKGWMAIKVDLEKAYDRLRWDFIKETLVDAGIPEHIMRLIMQCITTSSLQVLWNGEPSSTFLPQRGIRQGDPLSPYIFILCMERLSQVITQEVTKGRWKPVKMGRQGPPLSHLFFADDLLIMGTTDDRQIELVQDVLERFCVASGLRVSMSKTRIHFSKNLPQHTIRSICAKLNIQKTEDLGRYLGVPLLHRRVTKDTYRFILEKVQKKLSGWAAKSLSLAGRMTLAQAVLAAIPYYTMQSTRIPAATLREVQKHIKNFIWGHSNDHKGVHLVKWETLSQPKAHGGCGIRDLEAQNSAFLMKVAFKLHTEPDSLWVKVLRGKYNWTRKDQVKRNRTGASYLWRSIAAVTQELNVGLQWSMGDGSETRFWKDHWLQDRGPLHLLSDRPVNAEALELPISHFVSRNGVWKVGEFAHNLPEEVVQEIVHGPIPDQIGSTSSCFWGRDKKGFSVKSAYNLLQEHKWDEPSRLWGLAWKWRGPQRIRTFLWLALGGKLLTNAERSRRHMTDEATCEVCHCGVEDLDHVLRHCPAAQDFWKLIIPRTLMQTFNSLPYMEWITTNLRQNQTYPEWSTFFGIACWKLWTTRNNRIFSSARMQPHSLVHEVHHFFDHVTQASKTYDSLTLYRD